ILFFFQAEDGIRDWSVTGVQTCALPISMTGTRFNHIPYSGAGPAMNDVVGGHVSLMFAALSIVKAGVDAGKLRMIGVGSDRRSSEYPNVPTISESGVPGFEAKSWFGLVAPAGTPPQIIKKRANPATLMISRALWR